MSEPAPAWHRTCLRCGGEMEEGFLLTKSSSATATAEWVSGRAEKSVWTGVKLGGRRRLPVVTYRCTECGALDAYAPG